MADPSNRRSHRAADDLTTRVLNLVREGKAITRRDLVRQTGLGRTVVEERVEQAIGLGVLADADFADSTGGRPSRKLKFCPDRGTIHALDIGGQHIAAAVTDLNGAVMSKATAASDIRIGPEATLSKAQEMLDGLVKDRTGVEPWAISIAFPGPVDAQRRHSLSSTLNMPGWLGFDMPGWFARRSPIPTWVDNDLNALMLRTWERSSKDADHRNMVLMKVSNGVGMALLSEGHVHRGRFGRTGGIGHSTVATQGITPCICGQNNCLEALAGGWAIVRDATTAARDGESSGLTQRLRESGGLALDDVIAGAQLSDPVCVRLLQRSATLIGEALANVTTIFDPGVIRLTGVLPNVGEFYRSGVRRAMLEHSFQETAASVQIVHTPLEADDGIMSASTVAIQQLFMPDDDRQLWYERAKAVSPPKRMRRRSSRGAGS